MSRNFFSLGKSSREYFERYESSRNSTASERDPASRCFPRSARLSVRPESSPRAPFEPLSSFLFPFLSLWIPSRSSESRKLKRLIVARLPDIRIWFFRSRLRTSFGGSFSIFIRTSSSLRIITASASSGMSADTFTQPSEKLMHCRTVSFSVRMPILNFAQPPRSLRYLRNLWRRLKFAAIACSSTFARMSLSDLSAIRNHLYIYYILGQDISNIPPRQRNRHLSPNTPSIAFGAYFSTISRVMPLPRAISEYMCALFLGTRFSSGSA